MTRLAVVCACVFAPFAAAVLGGEPTRRDLKIAVNGNPAAVIVLGRDATFIERHAAEELARYIKEMSGATLRITTDEELKEGKVEGTAILIGKAKTNPLIASFVRRGKIELSAADPATDGFIIKTIVQSPTLPNSHAILIAGSADRATLYAVYYLLENLCDVGFFWDGDYIPSKKTIALPVCDISETPRFRVRQYLQGCAFGYKTAYWEWEDWKQEIDWMAKRYQNTMMMDWGHPEWRRVADYARKLGIKIISPGGGIGHVSEDFVKQHPNVRCVKMQWGENAPYYVIHPSDPMFVKRGAESVRRAIKLYGADHIYNVDPYAEQKVFLPPDEIEAMRSDFAKAVAEYIRKADPQGVWYASGWALLAPPWPKETAKAFLEAIPADMFYICDIWADEKPIYKKFDYFHGRDWGFGVLHSFGGDDTLRGDLEGLIRRVKEVANDPKADRCVAFYINPEIIHYNDLYFELAAKLSWDPDKVDLADFLEDYALRRYGARSAANMLECLKLLAKSVYSSSSRATEPYYQHRLHRLGADPTKYSHLDDLKEALTIALRERERQKDNELYANDLVDIIRQYIAELSNRHLQELYAAFKKGERERFEHESATVGRLMDALEKVLASRDDYRVSYVLEKTRRIGRDERGVKDGFLTFAGTPWLLDYQSKDMFELVRFYYRRRVDAFVSALRKALKPPGSPPTTPNILLNSGFEEGKGDQPANWGTGFVHKGGKTARVKEAGCSGEFCGRLDTPIEGSYANLFQDVRVQVGEAYCLSGRVKIKGDCSVQFAADIRTGDWPQTNYAIEYSIGGGRQGDHDWTPVSGYFIIPKPSSGKKGDTVTIRVYCRQEHGLGTSWFDDVKLQKVPIEQAPILSLEKLDAVYEKIEKDWLERPLVVERHGRVDAVETVSEAFAEISAR